MSRHVAVVGAGWSGLACALTLQDGGARVTLFDAAPQPGGRARRVNVTLGDTTYALDNGQHLLVGAYRSTLQMIARAGLDAEHLLLRMPFDLRFADGTALTAGHGPAPWHLLGAILRARGFSWPDRLSILRDVTAWKRQRWRVPADQSARSVLRHATPNVAQWVWNPLCLAALNVPLEDASAQIFLNVLADSFGARAAASDLLLPRGDLSALFPLAATDTMQRAGADVRLRCSVTAIRNRGSNRWALALRDGECDADAVVLALPPDRAGSLLASADRPELAAACAALQQITSAPIATIYLRYPPSTRLPFPMLALRDDCGQRRFAQWVFDRGALDRSCAGVFAAVISGVGPHLDLGRETLLASLAQQLTNELALPPPLASYLIVEKHATIKPGPGLWRPSAILPAAGLFIAGDAADSPYPSTIEGSVRAGIAAARAALNA